jgi:hypothetical protein
VTRNKAMKITRLTLFLCLLASSLPLVGQQVYRSTDDHGNLTFSDQPGDSGEAVAIPETNVGESVEVPPPAPAPATEPEPEAVATEIPGSLQGELDGVKKRDKKRSRPRKEPRGGR